MIVYLINIFNNKYTDAIIEPFNTTDKILGDPFSISYKKLTFLNCKFSEIISKLKNILINNTINTSL